MRRRPSTTTSTPRGGYGTALAAAIAAEKIVSDLYIEEQLKARGQLLALIEAEEAIESTYVHLVSVLQEVELMQTLIGKNC